MISPSFMLLSVPDTVSISVNTKEIIHHTCPKVTSELDIALTHEIATSILWGIGLVGFIIILCVTILAVSKYRTQRLRQEYEKEKRKSEKEIQEQRARLESAWRCLNDFYKKKENGVTEKEKEMAEASWEFLTNSLNEPSKSKSEDKE